MSEPVRILVSNDDGYASAGIQALAGALEGLGEVWVVAPESEQSAAAHAISLYRPLRLREVRPAGSPSTARPPTAPTWRWPTCSRGGPRS